MLQKRYQRYSKEGITWTQWFNISSSTEKEPWQVKGKLRNEYREIN